MNQFDFKKFYSLIDKREQYARNWSIRINNLVVPLELISRLGLSLAVMYTAYRTLIGPVLLKTIPGHCFNTTDITSTTILYVKGEFTHRK